MRYVEINEAEVKDAPLYHMMTVEKATNVFNNDTMPARWDHVVPGLGKMFGNSFTRNPNLPYHPPIKLTVDRAKLAQTNRIVPLDAEYVLPHTMNWPTAQHHEERRDRVMNRFGMSRQWAEEFIVGEIKRLHRVLIQIEIIDIPDKQRYTAREFITFVAQYAKQWSVPLTVHSWITDKLDQMDRDAEYDD